MINMIACVDEKRGLGYKGELLFHLTEDMRRFKELTMDKTIVMGRKTQESLPGGKPLPGRKNVVLTHQRDYSPAGFEIIHSFDEIAEDDVFVIGGAEVYQQALKAAQRIYLTKVFAEKEADVYFPEFMKAKQWKMCWQSDKKEENGILFCFEVYEK